MTPEVFWLFIAMLAVGWICGWYAEAGMREGADQSISDTAQDWWKKAVFAAQLRKDSAKK